ncbi:hypothetical protein BH20ACI4_BH20ACI4_09180 [soil metagenome]
MINPKNINRLLRRFILSIGQKKIFPERNPVILTDFYLKDAKKFLDTRRLNIYYFVSTMLIIVR